MVCASRLIVVGVDTQRIKVVNEFLSAKHLIHALCTAHHKEVVDLLVEVLGIIEDTIVGCLHIESEDCSAECSDIRELIHVVEHDVEGLVSTPRQSCHRTMVTICQGAEL